VHTHKGTGGYKSSPAEGCLCAGPGSGEPVVSVCVSATVVDLTGDDPEVKQEVKQEAKPTTG
jgi:hypothetical protein